MTRSYYERNEMLVLTSRTNRVILLIVPGHNHKYAAAFLRRKAEFMESYYLFRKTTMRALNSLLLLFLLFTGDLDTDLPSRLCYFFFLLCSQRQTCFY